MSTVPCSAPDPVSSAGGTVVKWLDLGKDLRELTIQKGGSVLIMPWLTYCSWEACMLSRFSCVRLFANPWSVACQAPLSMGLPRQEYWSGLPCSLLGDLLELGIESASPVCNLKVQGAVRAYNWDLTLSGGDIYSPDSMCPKLNSLFPWTCPSSACVSQINEQHTYQLTQAKSWISWLPLSLTHHFHPMGEPFLLENPPSG